MNEKGLSRYLLPVNVWALSFGCAVGWGAFVMPGTTFLPKAGPLGTAIGIGIGAVVMFIIGMNYHFLINRYKSAGGTFTYTSKVFSYDHGFLSAWFMLLVYIAISWANVTALALICRYVFPGVFQNGYMYTIQGYDVYLFEVILSIAIVLIFGLICIFRKRVASWAITVMAVVLFLGIIICFFAVTSKNGGPSIQTPYYSPNGKNPLIQIFEILVLTPWAFVGFESVSNSSEEYSFSRKKILLIMSFALIASVFSYVMLSQMATSVLPNGYENWTTYIANLSNISGTEGLPTFNAINTTMGGAGMNFIFIVALCAIGTGLVGNFIAASRLLYTMSKEHILPEWFGKLNSDGNPKNAFIFLIIISCIISFVGRTAVGWIVDVSTIGATIAYGYTSIVAFFEARKEKKKGIMVTGIIGLIASIIFFIYFMESSGTAMSTNSYLILAIWSIFGFELFRRAFQKDENHRFGKSMVVWVALLFLIFFTSHIWIRQSSEDMMKSSLENVRTQYESMIEDNGYIDETEADIIVEKETVTIRSRLIVNSLVQLAFIVLALILIYRVYSILTKRENKAAAEKKAAEEISRAKGTFLSNMSHDMRTPMNAIMGYTKLAREDGTSEEKMREYLDKIEKSGKHLLSLINDVLEMSRIESGKQELELVPSDIEDMLDEIRDLFSPQMKEKEIDFVVDTKVLKKRRVVIDRVRFNRILLNLVSNAYKFTPQGGRVLVTLKQSEDNEENGTYVLSVKDSGIGMSKEFAAHVFEAFERERTSTVSGIQGTGLGMAITKSLVDLMGGTTEVNTAPGKGTEFIITLSLAYATAAAEDEEEERCDEKTIDFTGKRILLAEDQFVNREIATAFLQSEGFIIECVENGQEAIDKYALSDPGYYDAILMDIQMPVLDGYEAAKAIRSLEHESDRDKRIPIIAMTANAFSEDVKKALDCGMDAHVAKPIDLEVLLQTLCEHMRED